MKARTKWAPWLVLVTLVLGLHLRTVAAALISEATSSSGFLEKSVELESENENATGAKKEMIERSIDMVSVQLITDILGESKFHKNRSLIQSKVIKNSGRFIPLVKSGELKKLVKGYQLTTNLSINVKTLEAMLLEQGLLYEVDALPSVVPFISVVDTVRGEKLIWWLKNQKSDALQSFALNAERSLQKAFWSSGFYVERPISGQLQSLVPLELEKESLSIEDLQTLGELFKAPVVLSGELQISALENNSNLFHITVRLSLFQSSNGKIVAESIRNIDTERGSLDVALGRKSIRELDGVFKDLAGQMLEAWQKGTFGSTLAKIQVTGALPLSKYQQFKEIILSKSRKVRQISERLIAQDQSTFEIAVNGSLEDVASQLGELTIPGGASYRVSGIEDGVIKLKSSGEH